MKILYKYKLLYLILLFLVNCIISFECAKWKSVDTSLHEKRNGNMGLGIQYSLFKWRFTNNSRVTSLGVEEAECIWQSILQNTGPDSISVAVGFRLFNIDNDIVDEIQYKTQKVVYPDTIASMFVLCPKDSGRIIRGSFWVEKENALQVVDGDIYIIKALVDTTQADTSHVLPDSAVVDEDSVKVRGKGTEG